MSDNQSSQDQIPTLIYCADGNRKFAKIAINSDGSYGLHKFKYGAQLPKTVYFQPYFADQDFKRPRYVGYIRALQKHRPHIASVLDIMEWRRFDEYIMRAEEISQYCTEVMLIPKVNGVVRELERLFPDKQINGKKIRLGYSVQTSFGGTDVPEDEFQDWPVHLLGGSPIKQLEKSQEMNVVSCDGNYHQLMSRYCKFFYPEFLWDEKYQKRVEDRAFKNPIWPTLFEFHGEKWGDGTNKADAPYEAFRRSCVNIMQAWQKLNLEGEVKRLRKRTRKSKRVDEDGLEGEE